MSWPEHGFSDEDEATNFALDHLRARGFSVTLAMGRVKTETAGEFRTRLGISTAHFARRMALPGCPHVDTDRGPSGRITGLRSNPEFEAFLAKKGAA